MFIRLYKYWYNNTTGKAEPVSDLIRVFETAGNTGIEAAVTPDWFKSLGKKDPFFGEKWDGVFLQINGMLLVKDNSRRS